MILVLIATWMYLGGTIARGRVLWTLAAVRTRWRPCPGVERSGFGPIGDWSRGFSGPLVVDYLGQATPFRD